MALRFARVLSLLNLHAEGEIGRVVTGGVLDIPGRTMLDKLRHLNEVDDSLRRFCVLEPRGIAQGSTNLLLPATEPGADAGFIVMQPDRCHAMSGSNAICVATALLETGMVAMQAPETALTLDTAAGLVRAVASCRDGRCERVTLTMPWSYVEAEDVPLDVPELGRVSLDIAFGGVFYALIDPASLGLAIRPETARALVDTGMRILAAAKEKIRPSHPERPGLDGLAYLMFAGTEAGRPTNATILPPGRLDRSPCGTGSAARLALMHARGDIDAGGPLTFHSAIGSRFEAAILETGEVAGRPAVRPSISGRAWIYGREEIGIDPADPFTGHALADCWGPGVADIG